MPRTKTNNWDRIFSKLDQIATKIGSPNPSEYGMYTEEEMMQILRCSRNTLRRLRVDGLCPPHIKLGGRILYPQKAFEEWFEGLVDG